MNPNELPLESENALSAIHSPVYEKLYHGTVRTGKTRNGLKETIAPMFTYPRMDVGIFRANAVDMKTSIRPDLREICSQAWGREIRVQGGEEFHTLHINGGKCRLLGINDEKYLLGTKFDRVFLSQLEQIKLEQYMKLLTRMQGSAVLVNGWPVRRVVSDGNPDEPDHWMYRREAAGQLKIFDFHFEDNPHFYRGGRWTVDGYDYVRRAKKGVTGLYYDRYILGLRVSSQGAVFHIEPCHLIDFLPDLSSYHIFNAIDFGTTGTAVILWIAWQRTLNDMIVFKEWRKSNTNIMEVGDALTAINSMEGIMPELTIIDNDADNASVLDEYFGVRVQMTTKGPRSVERNYQYIAAKLINAAVPDRGNGIRFYTGMPAYFDTNPEVQAKPKDLIQELRRVTRDDAGKIDKQGGHGVDALGYFLAWVILTYQESHDEAHGLNLYDINRG